MLAYPDNKCYWGYMLICAKCIKDKPYWVNSNPIKNPPALGKKCLCELCGKKFTLENPK